MINEKVGSEEMQAVGGVIGGLINLLYDIQREQAKKKGYVEERSGVVALLKHLENGGRANTNVVEVKDAPVMEACMKSQHIPFVSTKTTDDTGKEYIVFVYRNSDEVAMNKAKSKFISEMGIGSGHADLREFINSNINKTVNMKKGFGEVELEILTEKSKEENFMFSCVKSESDSGKYDVYYMPINEEKMKKAIISMEYDLSGEKGSKYRSEVNAALTNRKNFEKEIGNVGEDILVIVDTENPSSFITVKRENFTVHSIGLSKQKAMGGKTESVLSDKNTITISSYNRDKLMDYVETLDHPVIMKMSDFKLIKGLTKTNEAVMIPEEEFRKEYKKMKDVLKTRTDKYEGKAVKAPTKISDKIYTYKNIPQRETIALYEEIENNNLLETVLVSDTLACSEKDYGAIKGIMERYLYRDKSPLERIEAKYLYEEDAVLNLTGETERVQYVLDIEAPNYVIKIAPDGMTLIQNGNEEAKIAKKEAEYDDFLVKTLSTVRKPVVMTEEEMQSETKEVIIRDKMNERNAGKAAEYLKNVEVNEKEQLNNLRDLSDTTNLNGRQRETVEKVKVHTTEEIYVDRTLTEKIQDQTTDKKIVSEQYENTVELER